MSSQNFHTEFERETIPHSGILYNYALRMAGDRDDAYDLLQETFLKAYRFWDKFEKGTNVRAWLFRIMKNTYINLYRKLQKEPDTVDFNDVEEFYADPSVETDFEERSEEFLDNLFDNHVSAALESLPEEYRSVVTLRNIDSLTYEEISEMLGVPIGTVRSRIHRGRKILFSKLSSYAQKRGYRTEAET